MKMPMFISVSRNGISINYRCYKLPGHGKKCPDKNTDVCFKCKYCKAEMSGYDATRLLNSFSKKISEIHNIT